MERRAGILLHPSSLPGPYGVGDLGPAAREWLGWLSAAGQRIWQFLPLSPVDHAGSPYASPSAFAHEPLLLSIDDLVADGWLSSKHKPYARGSRGIVDWPAVRAEKTPALTEAANAVRAQVDLARWSADHPELATWALYQAIHDELGVRWADWPVPLRDRHPDALAEARDRLAPAIDRELALQWLFDQQWERLHAEARRRGIELWGDVPIFVSYDSADPWARPHLWRLDADRRPVVVSGVPPDAFSADGQLWGHPLYDEDAHRAEQHAWWIARFRRALSAADRVRIDHFRGMEAVWEVPAGDTDAKGGRWIPGPGRPLLDAVRAVFPQMPFVAEDLGVITDDVRALRDAFGLPGMVILQFAFSGDALDLRRHHHPYLPHAHRAGQVCYTGTHDNDTVLGWYRSADEGTRDHVRRYLSATDADAPGALIRSAWRSVCDTAVVPLQDLLELGSEARMNVPGRAEGNWSWRMPGDALQLALAKRLHAEAEISGRLP
jgi:4-alpha-glucanotransferase